MTNMTLHDAIEKLLRQKRRPMTAREIADELNLNKWYTKGDRSSIKTNQILARVDDHPDIFEIDRTVSPFQIKLIDKTLKKFSSLVSIKTNRIKTEKIADATIDKNIKTSFDPISNLDTTVLILGSMPGDTSMKFNEYYKHTGNRFWKILSTITNNLFPVTYPDKVNLLLKNKIGIWDVAHKASRRGSLDSDIKDEVPNDLESFILNHKNLKIIGFNGKKPQVLYDKYFDRKSGIIYISLPSTSSANNGMAFESICKYWRQILKLK